MVKINCGLITHGTGEKQWVMSFLYKETLIHYDPKVKERILKLCIKIDSILSDILRKHVKIANESYKFQDDADRILASHKKFQEFVREKYDR